MLVYSLMLTLCIFSARAEEENELPPNEKNECIKQLVEWCKGMEYPEGDTEDGFSLMSVSYNDKDTHYRVFCSTDSEGTNCTRNGFSWFVCSPDHVLTYKGEVMSESSSTDDEDICESASKVIKDLFIKNIPSDETLTRMHEELELFFKALEDMQGQMSVLREMMNKIPGIEDGFFSGLGFDAFDSEIDPEIVTLPTDSEEGSEEDSNDIEKEFNV